MTTVTVNPTITESSAGERRLPAQIWAEGALAQHPHRLELRGATESLTWPAVCAYCGARADERIEVRKNFRPRPRRRGSSRGLGGPITGKARVPFCSGCVREHRAMETHERPGAGLLRGLFHPLIIPVAGSAYFGLLVVREGLPSSPFAPESRIAWGLAAVLWLNFFWCLFLLWRVAIRRRVPPQTEITRACDFSEDVSQMFEKERRIYAIRNEAFASALAASNAGRVWTDEDQKSSRRQSYIVSAGFLLILAAAAIAVQLFGGWPAR